MSAFRLFLQFLFFAWPVLDLLAVAAVFGVDPIDLSAMFGTDVARLAIGTLAGHVSFLLWYLRLFYAVPLSRLRRQIALFLTGGQRPGQFETQSVNPRFTFVNLFLSRSLEILVKFRKEMEEGRVLRSEVEIAAELQKHTLKQTKVEIPGIDLVARSKSATEVGGDSYDIIQRGGNYYVYIGDVTGHGVPSGFVMMIANALISAFSQTFESGADVLAKTNEILKPRVKSNMLMTLLMVRWNHETKRLWMTGAGHEYLVIYRRQTGIAVKIQTGGIALGMTRDISKLLKEREIEFAPGDIAVLYTDGITEARNGRGSDALLFGIDRLVEAVEGAESKTAQGVFNAVTVALSRFMGYRHVQLDDITLIVMHYRDREQVEIPSADIRWEFITEWNW